MVLDLSDNHRAIRQKVLEFATAEIAPNSAQWDEDGKFPSSVVTRLGELGITGLVIPREYGGSGSGILPMVVALEELAKADVSVALSTAISAVLCGRLLTNFGTAQQKQKWLVPLAQGKTLGAFALTEPEAGSDLDGMTTRAMLVDGNWTIRGCKTFITNAGTPLTSFIILTAVTNCNLNEEREFSSIIVPSNSANFKVGPPQKKLGWRASDTRRITLEDCRVVEANLLGNRGQGLAQSMWALDGARIGIAAISVGLAQACLNLSLSYSQKRRAFGRPISGFQAIQLKLADMSISVHLARMATYRAAALMDRGKCTRREVAMVKLFASEAAVKVADEALQIHGGAGCIEDIPIARFYRDARMLPIGGGTSEIMRLIIAKELTRESNAEDEGGICG